VSSSSQFQLAGLSSHVEFELMPSFGITHDDSRSMCLKDRLRGHSLSKPRAVSSPTTV